MASVNKATSTDGDIKISYSIDDMLNLLRNNDNDVDDAYNDVSCRLMEIYTGITKEKIGEM